MKKKYWYKLDNVGAFYSLANNKAIPAVFRYSVELKENIDEKILDAAVEKALKEFPNFNCRLRKGLFWHFLETSTNKVKVEKENLPICYKLYEDSEDILFRVTYYKKRINLEISHIISDGRGAFTFLECIIANYLEVKENLKDVKISTTSSIHEKTEDSFDKYYTGLKLKFPKFRRIYKYKGRKRNEICFMEYHISTSKALELAHKYNTTLTALLISVLICSYQKEMKDLELNKTIKIEVPVDLRKYFGSETSRNFFGLSSIYYTFGKRDYNFDDVIKSVSEQIKETTSKENLEYRMNQMIYLQKNLVTRTVPLFLKDIVLKLTGLLTENSTTPCLSNVGQMKVDPKLEPYIESINITNTSGSLKFTICSFKDNLSFGISSKYTNNAVVKNFCRFFSDNGIPGTMNIDMEEEDA